MLDAQTITRIEEFVYIKPRSIQEIAQLIEKSWKTADRYISEVQINYGTISTIVFREGTRGALKIAYWSSVEKVSYSVFQQRLEEDINISKRRDDFSAFDIYQYVPKKQRTSTTQTNELNRIEDFNEFLKKTNSFFFRKLIFC